MAQTGPQSMRVNGEYPVSGYVTTGPEGAPVANGARVELHATSGAILLTISTSGNGNFAFNNISNGEYYVYVALPGYDPLNQVIEVSDAPITELRLELHLTPDPAAKDSSPNNGSNGPTVSARELSIPRKAHDAFEIDMLLLYRKADYKGGLSEFQRAIQAFPTYYEAYAQMGTAYMKLGDSANAEQALRKSIELSSEKYVDAYCYLALLFSSNQRFADAEPLARKATELDKTSWLALTELARALYGLNRLDEAEVSGLAAVKLQPNDPSLQLMLADIHGKLHDYPALLNDLSTYLKLDPNGSEAPRARETSEKIRQALANAPAAGPASSESNPNP